MNTGEASNKSTGNVVVVANIKNCNESVATRGHQRFTVYYIQTAFYFTNLHGDQGDRENSKKTKMLPAQWSIVAESPNIENDCANTGFFQSDLLIQTARSNLKELPIDEESANFTRFQIDDHILASSGNVRDCCHCLFCHGPI